MVQFPAPIGGTVLLANSLAALARTHTSYQREAERALYDTIYISTFRDDSFSLKCMKTLAMNPEKAAFVRFLTIQYARHNTDKNRRVTTYLFKSLINMRSLSDFRIRFHPNDVARMKGLGKILCQGHFRLQTLYCPAVPNIFQTIKSQTELQILGIYNAYGGGSQKSLKELHNNLPIVLTLDRESFTLSFDHISIFPALYSVDRCSTIHQVLVQSFSKESG